MPTRQERLEGGIWGCLIGDACGVPYEFHRREQIPPLPLIEFIPPPGFARAHLGTPPGTWSDDGAHALCLLASLLYQGRLDLEDLGRRLINWYEHGYMAVDGRVFDVGVQTGQALRALRQGIPAQQAGRADELGNGNGSLMRVLPLALWHQGSDAQLVADAHRQSLVTHGHPRAQVCCALYCLWARRTLEDATDPWSEAVRTLRGVYAHDERDIKLVGELEFHVRPDDLASGHQGSGYVVDCLRSARWAVAQGSYEDVIKAAISLGRDTDTTACVAGGIAGVRDGVEGIPHRWRDALRDRELAEPLVKELLALGA
jgi:ADP-ribosyl-[dinitrogen reductase] hydrolase